jgi:tRNA A-37 threonylcarbamoyl transferase component Bud32
MPDTSRCPDCGAELSTGATAGLCPKCLLAGALESSDAPADSPFAATTPQPGGFLPPAVARLAPHFPSLEILQFLGHGGMGAVYQARQIKLDRIVALKIIRPESVDDPAFAERFMREARTLARLSHSNIVAIHDFGETSVGSDGSNPVPTNLYYFVMEYIDGANLRQFMQAGALPPAQALAIVPQICDALHYAHEEGIIHRDIKPENILIDRRGRVKIADFGLAKLAAQAAENFTLTGTHQIMGTPRYMAPEQMEGSHLVDHRADIYSLGVVFYEMLTGELPLGRFEPPSRKAGVDARLDDVVHRALAREPAQRYQRASEIRRDVEAVVLDVLAQGGAESQPSPESIAAGLPGPSTILERQVAGVVNWLRGDDAPPAGLETSRQSEAERAVIRRQVRAPAIALILWGMALLFPAALLLTNGFDMADGNDGKPWTFGLAMMGGALCLIILSGIVIRGAWHMLSLDRLRPALVASILAQPLGIWPLVVLSRPHVKAALATPGVVTQRGPWSIANPALWCILIAGLAIATPFLPWVEILKSEQGTPGTWYAAAGFAWPHGLIASSALAAIMLFLFATAGMRPVHVARPAVVAVGTLVVLACTISFDTDLKRGDLAVQPLLDAASWGVQVDGRRPVTIAEGPFVTRRLGAPYVLMGLAVAMLALAAFDLRAALAGRAAGTIPNESGRQSAHAASAASKPALSPVARFGFTISRQDDVGTLIKFHFGELGYRLVNEAPGEWLFERGKRFAAFWESNIRLYHTTLTVRCIAVGGTGQRVSCTWAVSTLGLAHIGRRDVAVLEAEGRELETLLTPSVLNAPSAAAQSRGTGALPPDETPDEVNSTQESLDDLDMRRIEMELKAPSAGLMFVAGLILLVSVITGIAIVADGWSFTRGQFRAPPPIEVLGAVAATTAVLLVVAAIVNGARHMRRMTGYAWCIAASFLVMLPWSAAILAGLPIGIWAFRTLRRPEVRDAFLKRALEVHHQS